MASWEKNEYNDKYQILFTCASRLAILGSWDV